jgi:uncharacterized damage-inducible protein DinB
MPEAKLEPWMRGTHTDLPSPVRAVIHALEMATEDVERWCAPLTDEEWQLSVHGLAPVAFQLRHIMGSVDRLLTYAEGNQLSPEQLERMKAEQEPGAAGHELLQSLPGALRAAERRVRALADSNLELPRALGRKQLPTSVGGLLVHVADHTQRHVGELIITTKLLLRARGVF